MQPCHPAGYRPTFGQISRFGTENDMCIPAADKAVAGFIMFRKALIFICTFMVAATAVAQTPVEDVIFKYENVSGARNFIAKGARMVMARALLKNSPVASIASDVNELAILKMENAPQETRTEFADTLMSVLKDYDYYGKQSTKNGIVDIYVLHGNGFIEELVIYNPGIWSLNSLRGDFTAEQLLELDKSR